MSSKSSLLIPHGVVIDARVLIDSNFFIPSVQELYETCLLAHAFSPKSFTHISLVLLGPKGYETILDTHSLSSLDNSFKQAFAKLKHLLKFYNQKGAIFSSTGDMDSVLLEMSNQFKKKLGSDASAMFIISARDEEVFQNEMESFLYRINDPHIKLTILHLARSQTFQGGKINPDFKDCLSWFHFDDPERDPNRFFKGWLINKKKNWTMSMASGWKVGINVEDTGLNPSTPPDFTDEEDVNGVELIQWVRRDGVPAGLIFGTPKRIIPSSPDDVDRIRSMSSWLLKEDFVGIARLRTNGRIMGCAVIFPGSCGGLAMRSIASRELILPVKLQEPTIPTQDDMMNLDDGMESLAVEEEVLAACNQQIHVHKDIPTSASKSGAILKAIENKILQEVPVAVSHSGSFPLRIRNFGRK